MTGSQFVMVNPTFCHISVLESKLFFFYPQHAVPAKTDEN